MRFLQLWLCIIGGCLFSTVALADTVFMVQLGSYDSSAASDAAWKQISDENETLLEGLSHLNSRISLPPENNEIFRLQAGPISNRADAKRICETLRAAEEECFVVETAMFIGEDAPQQMLASASEAESAEVEEESNAGGYSLLDEITNAVAAPFLSSPQTAETALTESAEETAEAVEEIAEDTPEIILPSTLETEETELETASAVETESDTTLPWLRRKGQPRVTAVALPASEEETVETAAEEVEEEIAQATQMQEAIEAEAEAEETVEEVTAAAPTPAPAPVAAPQRVVSSVLSRSRMKSEVIMQQLPGVKMVSPEAVTPTIKLAAAQEGEGSVEVAEAIPVPLSDITAATEAAAQEPASNSGLPIFKERRALGYRGTPSQNFLQQSFWVKLNYFADEEAAKAYWNKLRKEQPELTKNLRMRISKPYSQRKITNRVSMQLGPLMAYQDVQNLCKIAGTPDLVCEVQRNSGVSATNQKRSADNQERYVSRRDIQNNARVRGARTPQFWAQVGSYRNRGDAMKMWDELKQRHAQLKELYPHLAHPPYSSSERTVYRLRTGPFATRTAAEELCSGLEAASTPCLVVSN